MKENSSGVISSKVKIVNGGARITSFYNRINFGGAKVQDQVQTKHMTSDQTYKNNTDTKGRHNQNSSVAKQTASETSVNP